MSMRAAVQWDYRAELLDQRLDAVRRTIAEAVARALTDLFVFIGEELQPDRNCRARANADLPAKIGELADGSLALRLVGMFDFSGNMEDDLGYHLVGQGSVVVNQHALRT